MTDGETPEKTAPVAPPPRRKHPDVVIQDGDILMSRGPGWTAKPLHGSDDDVVATGRHFDEDRLGFDRLLSLVDRTDGDRDQDHAAAEDRRASDDAHAAWWNLPAQARNARRFIAAARSLWPKTAVIRRALLGKKVRGVSRIGLLRIMLQLRSLLDRSKVLRGLDETGASSISDWIVHIDGGPHSHGAMARVDVAEPIRGADKPPDNVVLPGEPRTVVYDVGPRGLLTYDEVVAMTPVELLRDKRVNIHVLRHVDLIGPDAKDRIAWVAEKADERRDAFNHHHGTFAMDPMIIMGLRMLLLGHEGPANGDRKSERAARDRAAVREIWREWLEEVVRDVVWGESRDSNRSAESLKTSFCTGWVAHVFDIAGFPCRAWVDEDYLSGFEPLTDETPDGRRLNEFGKKLVEAWTPPGMDRLVAPTGIASAGLASLNDDGSITGAEANRLNIEAWWTTSASLTEAPGRAVELVFTDQPYVPTGEERAAPTFLFTPRVAHDSHSFVQVGRLFPTAMVDKALPKLGQP